MVSLRDDEGGEVVSLRGDESGEVVSLWGDEGGEVVSLCVYNIVSSSSLRVHQAYELSSNRIGFGLRYSPTGVPIRPTDAFMAQLFVRPITATRRLPRGEHPLL